MVSKNIVLVDDHVLVRNGLKELIEKIGTYKIVAQFDNGRELVEAFPMNILPDLIMMDISMPEMDGDEAMAILNSKEIKIPVLILTLNQDDSRMLKLFRLGVRGYLQKNCSAIILKQALEDIFRSGYYHNEFLTLSLQTTAIPEKKNDQRIILEKLTDRERVFLRLVCDEHEYTYDQIAGEMGVHHRTVDGYRESIFEKFGIKSKTGLVLFVLKNRLVDEL
jgi:two-component system, NarL family, invasion response regulator UvrY